MNKLAQQIIEPKAIVSLNDPQRISTVVKAMVRVADAWSLKNAQASTLYDVPTATWSRMKAGSFKGNLDQDKMMRASLLIGIFKGLRLLFNGPLEKGWPTQPNNGPVFLGQTPVEKMITGGIPSIMAVRRHIDALRGGL